jgi:transcriptional regulator with XRE-family HTH domain
VSTSPIRHAEFQSRFGELLRKARQDAGLTYPELARRSGRGERYIRYIERGERKASWRTIVAIVRALPISSELARAVEHWYPQPNRQRLAGSSEFIENFPKLLQEARESAGLSIRGLAGLSGMDPTYLSRIQAGKVPPPQWTTMSAIVAQLPGSRLAMLAETAGAGKVEDSVLKLTSDLEMLLASLSKTTLNNKAWVSAVQKRLRKCMMALTPSEETSTG